MKDLEKNTVTWPATSLRERFDDCRKLLFLHGLLSEKENEKVKARLEKLAKKQPQPPTKKARQRSATVYGHTQFGSSE